MRQQILPVALLFTTFLHREAGAQPTEPAPAPLAVSPIPSAPQGTAAGAESASEPFAWGDFFWLNGSSRQTSRLLDSKYFTPQLDADVNYSYSFNHPIDNTVVGSTALARSNELQLAYVGLGGDIHAGSVHGRLMLQFGTRATTVPRNDVTALRGQFDLQTAYRYIGEAYVGYHFNQLHGINLDVGLFMGFGGGFSYTSFENWAYQPSFTSDNTPWFFNGARLQIFPTDRLKFELWLINGWQSYGKFNQLPGVGYQVQYSPREWIRLASNGYVGVDTQDHPGRVRVHTDSSAQLRYYDHPGSKGLSRAAFSVTFDLGFEQGDGVQAVGGSGTEGHCTDATPCAQNYVSGMTYNRLWFFKNTFGWTFGGGFNHNPGRYLLLIPSGVAATTFDTSPGTSFTGWDLSTAFDWMPSELITWRVELVHRESSVPYFAGPGGVTSPDGYKTGGVTNPDGLITTPTPAGGFTPDLVKQETRVILALLFRI